jgi:metal-responsive CopG/Arc/MetJ family transcriptional regulator
MGVKVNFVLDDDVKSDLDRLVENGMRSRIINQALRKELLQVKRRRLAEKHDQLCGRTTAVATREIVANLRRDRSRR